MTLKKAYAQAMEWLYMACIVLSGAALVVITLIIPYGAVSYTHLTLPTIYSV